MPPSSGRTSLAGFLAANFIKNVFQSRRFLYKGMDNIETEWTRACSGSPSRLRQGKTGTLFCYRIALLLKRTSKLTYHTSTLVE